MEEVPLDDVNIQRNIEKEEHRVQREEEEWRYKELRKQYQQIITEAFKEFQKLQKDGPEWHLIPPPHEKETVHLYERDCDDGRYLLKVKGVLKAPAKRVLLLNKDHNWQTRRVWDHADLDGIEQHQQFDCGKRGTIRLVQSWVKMPAFASVIGVYDRDFLGLQWDRHDRAKGTYTLIFQTIEHSEFECPSDRVAATGLTGVWIKELDDPKECLCLMLAHVDAGGSIPETIRIQLVRSFKEKFRQRMHLYERVCQPEVWDKIYKPRTEPRRPPVKK